MWGADTLQSTFTHDTNSVTQHLQCLYGDLSEFPQIKCSQVYFHASIEYTVKRYNNQGLYTTINNNVSVGTRK